MCNFFKGAHQLYPKKELHLWETIIQFENLYEYLGVEINDNSQFSPVKVEQVKKARKAIGMIYFYQKNFYQPHVMFLSN